MSGEIPLEGRLGFISLKKICSLINHMQLMWAYVLSAMQPSLGASTVVHLPSDLADGVTRSFSLPHGGQNMPMDLAQPDGTPVQLSPRAVILLLPTFVSTKVLDGSVSFPPVLIYEVRSDGYGCWPSSIEEVFPSMVCTFQANPERVLVATEGEQHKEKQGAEQVL